MFPRGFISMDVSAHLLFQHLIVARTSLCDGGRRSGLGSRLIDGDRGRIGRGGGGGVRGERGKGCFCLMSERQKSFARRAEAMFTFTGTAEGGGRVRDSRTSPPLTYIPKHMWPRAHYADRRRRRIHCLSGVLACAIVLYYFYWSFSCKVLFRKMSRFCFL